MVWLPIHTFGAYHYSDFTFPVPDPCLDARDDVDSLYPWLMDAFLHQTTRAQSCARHVLSLYMDTCSYGLCFVVRGDSKLTCFRVVKLSSWPCGRSGYSAVSFTSRRQRGSQRWQQQV